MTKSLSAANLVEDFLRGERDYLIRTRIQRSKVAVIDRVIKSRILLEDVWAEIIDKCPKGKVPNSTREKWHLLVDRVIEDAAYAPPEKIKESRDAIARIAELNFDIAEAAENLASLIRKREMLRGRGDVALPDDHTPIELLRRAAELSDDERTRGLFEKFIWPTLDGLDKQFDMKYWPATVNLLEALAEAQHMVDPTPQDRYVAAATESRKSGYRDFMRVLDKTFDELARPCYVGERVDLSPKSFAALCNSLLGLVDEINVSNVKMYRQDLKKRAQNTG